MKSLYVLLFIYISFVAGVYLMKEINKGIRPLPRFTSLMYLIKKHMSLCYTLRVYHTHSHTHIETVCHMLPPRKKKRKKTSVSMGTQPSDDAGKTHKPR